VRNKITSAIEAKFAKDQFWANLYINFAKQVVGQCNEAKESFASFRKALPVWVAGQDDVTRRNAVGLIAFVNSPAWPADN
jgi:hypothetical protein